MFYLRKLGTVLAASLSLASTAQAETWIMASGYPEDSFFTKNIRMFIDEVEEADHGRERGPELVADCCRSSVAVPQE